jgi:hypothetical protein
MFSQKKDRYRNHNTLIESHWHKTLLLIAWTVAFHWRAARACIENMYLNHVKNSGNTCSQKRKDKCCNHNTLMESHWHRTFSLVVGTIIFHWRAARACIENMYLNRVKNSRNTCPPKTKDRCGNHNTLVESHWHKTLFLVVGTVAFHWKVASALKICT